MARILGGRWIKGPPVSTISIENSRKKKLWEVPAMFLRPKKIKEGISLLPFPGFRFKLTLQNENYHIETPEREFYSSKPIGSRQNFSIERFHSRAPFLLRIPVNAEKAFEIREESISKRPLCSQDSVETIGERETQPQLGEPLDHETPN